MIPLAPLLALFNIKKILTFLSKNWKEVIVISMLFLIWYQNFSETKFLIVVDTIPNLRAKLEESKKQFEICKEGNEKLSNAIEEQNQKILRLKNKVKEVKDEYNILKENVKKEREENKNKINDILNERTPQNCKEATEYLKRGIEDLKW